MIDQELIDLELKISKLLRYGVLAAGLFLLIAWAATLDPRSNPFLTFADYHPQSLRQSLEVDWHQGNWGLLTGYFGLFVLISLPFLRVLMTAYLFMKQKEKVLAWVACFVLAVLVISFSLGFEL